MKRVENEWADMLVADGRRQITHCLWSRQHGPGVDVCTYDLWIKICDETFAKQAACELSFCDLAAQATGPWRILLSCSRADSAEGRLTGEYKRRLSNQWASVLPSPELTSTCSRRARRDFAA